MRRDKDRRDRDRFDHKAKAYHKLERRREQDRDQERELRQMYGNVRGLRSLMSAVDG